jgi:UDP-glucose 4-epimerase
MTENVLITGGSGYIGTNLSAYLSKKDFNVWQFDKKDSGLRPDSNVERLEKIGSNIDLIVHLAAFPGIVNCINDFERAVTDNISTAFNIFRIGKIQRIPVIFTSSQAAKDPHDNFYASIKRIIEVEAERLNREEGADIRVFRLTNVYGGDKYLESKNTVVKMFIRAKQSGEKMVINGNGKQVRDFIHVLDVCEAIWLCSKKEKEKGFLLPIDVGTGKGVSVLDLAKMLKSKFTFDKKSGIVGISKSVANPDQAFKLFGFKAKHKLSTYIKGD